MRTIIFIAFTCFIACGQSVRKDKNATQDPGPEILNSKYVKLVGDTNTLMLIQDVVIKYGNLYAEADSALLEKHEQTITVFGIKKAQFNGANITRNQYNTFIKYKKGEARFLTN